MASVRVVDPVAVVQAPDLTITEFFGNVASGTPSLSACVAEVRRATEEAPQCPDFDELVLVLEGQVIREHAGGTTAVDAGQGAMLKAGTRVKWIWPGPCKYIPICTPAFTPENCGREDDGGHHAKTSESMDALRQLHYKARHPWLYHCALRSNWEAAKASGADYKPPTYAQDGFTHATADPALLIGVLNHFYRGSQGDWVCLRMSNKSLDAAGIPVKFEARARAGSLSLPLSRALSFSRGDEKLRSLPAPRGFARSPSRPSATLPRSPPISPEATCSRTSTAASPRPPRAAPCSRNIRSSGSPTARS